MKARSLTIQIPFSLLLAAAAVSLLTQPLAWGEEYLNGIRWDVPPIVTPGETNDQPPSDAVILFDGSDLSEWNNGQNWKVEDGIAYSGKGPITTTEEFGDCQLHIEWSAP